MTPKEIAELVVKYHETGKDLPDPKCCKCKGTGIEHWTNHHNGNDETSKCDCLFRTRVSIERKLEYKANFYSKEMYKICKGYLLNNKIIEI